MKRIWLIVLMAAVCACHPPRPHDVIRAALPPPGPDRVPGLIVDGPPPLAVKAIRTAAPEETLPSPRDAPRRDIEVAVREINGQLQDAFFDYDRSDARADAIRALEHDAALVGPLLAGFPQLRLRIEGHCDERGSAEYNLALGDRRAASAAEVLRGFGVSRQEAVSFGKESPQCTEPVESCWRLNRRAHLVVLNQ